MTKRRLLIVIALVIFGIALLWLLRPCSPQPSTTMPVGISPQAPAASPQKSALSHNSTIPTKETSPTNTPAPAPAPAPGPPPAPAGEIDSAPPVELKAGDELPDVAKCVATKFPAEAKPHVQSATVTVRLVVDKFGNVRSVKTTAVDFGQEPAEDVLPMLRKAFIQAGNRAFGAKKCPPHIVGGQAVGYAIEVPLRYKH